MIYGSNVVSGNTVTIIASTNVAFMLIPQYTVLSSIHPGHRNWMEVVGVVSCVVGIIHVIHSGTYHEQITTTELFKATIFTHVRLVHVHVLKY